jgi:hemerythrin-like domain-containing protein
MASVTMIDGNSADIREMYVVHDALRREYGLLPGLVLGVENEDAERAGIVAGHVAFLNSVLHRHHDGEDRHLWPKILTRGAPAIAPLIRTVEGQHEDIDAAMTEVNVAVTTWCQKVDSRQATVLARAIDVLVARLDEHLRLEEQQVLPLIEKHVTASEWTRMAEEGGADTPPEDAAVIFGMMMYDGDPAVLRDMLSHMPTEVAEVLGAVSQTAYAEYCQKIHGSPALDSVRAQASRPTGRALRDIC